MAEHGLDGATPVIGVAFDGTGYGDDGAVWGGEILLADYDGYQRVRPPGATCRCPAATPPSRNPYRMALAHLRAAGMRVGPTTCRCVRACPADERGLLARQLERGLRLRPDLQHGPALRRGLLAGRHLPPRRVRGPGRRRTGGRRPRRGRRRRRGTRFGAAGAGDRHRSSLDPAPVLAAVVADVRAGTAPGRWSPPASSTPWSTSWSPRCVRRAPSGPACERSTLSGGVFANALLHRGLRAGLRADGLHRAAPPPRARPTTAGWPSARWPCCAAPRDARTAPSGRRDTVPERRRHVPGGTRAGLEIEERDGTRMAHRDFGGVVKEVCLEYVPDLQVGEYAIVHVGLRAAAARRGVGPGDAGALPAASACCEEEFGDQWGRAAEQAGPADAARPTRRGAGGRHEVPRGVPGPGAGPAAAGRHPRHGDPALGADGGLRRPDPLHHPARHRPAPARRHRVDPRPRLPGVRHPAGGDRQGAGDRLPARTSSSARSATCCGCPAATGTCSGSRAPAATSASSTPRSTRSKIAQQNPDRQVVFFGIGFETTAPPNAMTVYQARRLGIRNFSLLVSHVRVPPAIEAIMTLARLPGAGVPGRRARVQRDGHRGSTRRWPSGSGCRSWSPASSRWTSWRASAAPCTSWRAASTRWRTPTRAPCADEGNPAATAMLEDVFEVTDRAWRGIGVDPGERLAAVASATGEYDAEHRFSVGDIPPRSPTRLPQRRGAAGPDQAARVRGLRHHVHPAQPARRHHGLQRGRLRRVLPLPAAAGSPDAHARRRAPLADATEAHRPTAHRRRSRLRGLDLPAAAARPARPS